MRRAEDDGPTESHHSQQASTLWCSQFRTYLEMTSSWLQQSKLSRNNRKDADSIPEEPLEVTPQGLKVVAEGHEPVV
ncbi:hypothetical protein MMC10_008146, partial [Thelotrema lepadinum]|nr:hypothetical protein [Thelotrema lepadinum]